MAKDTIEFTASLIKAREQSIKESISHKASERMEARLAKKITESKKLIKEAEEKEEDEEVKALQAEEAEAASEEAKTAEVDTEDIETVDTIEDADNFEESISDDVFFCNVCGKHFLATEDTAPEDIICPFCQNAEEIVALGSAEDALEEAENAEVAVVIEDEAAEAEEDVIPEEDEEAEFDEESVQESFNTLLKRYVSDKSRIRVKEGKITADGDLVLSARMYPTREACTITFKNFKESYASKCKKFVVEGSASFLKNSKIKASFVKEGNVYAIKKMGYGFITESTKQGKSKVTGIIG